MFRLRLESLSVSPSTDCFLDMRAIERHGGRRVARAWDKGYNQSDIVTKAT